MTARPALPVHRRSRPARGVWLRAATLVVAVGMVSGCSTLREIATLRTVDFGIDRVDDVRIAGIRLDQRPSYSDLDAQDVRRLAAAVLSDDVPLDLVIHVRAENPAENRVSARLVDLDWTLFLEDRKTVSGKLAGTYLLPPGEPVDVPVGAHLDLVDFFRGSARDLFELARALAGYGTATKELRLEALPTIQTSLGPIRYPEPIVLRRTVGNR